MPRWSRILLLAVAAFAVAQWWSGRESPSQTGATVPLEAPAGLQDTGQRYPSFLPPEAVATLEAIERGGPFPYDRDGSVFQNRERRLPERARGYYREYTVVTPGSRDRGARRIVSGGDPPEVYYYTDDHYRSFRRVEVPP
jgi:guanyl-specific ribonuclease Sa